MSLTITKHPHAERDLLLIFVYLGERNLDAAERFLIAIEEDLKRLADMPGMGTLREFKNPTLKGVRSLPVSGFSNYLMLFRATESELQLIHVVHGARDLDAMFGR